MIISNYKTIKIISFSLVILILTGLAALTVFYYILNYFLIVLTCLAISIILLFQMRCTTFEISGGCISIKKYHPFTFKKFIYPSCEFPLSSVKNFVLNNVIFTTTVYLEIISRREKKFPVKLMLFGFSSLQKKQIRNLLNDPL